MNMRNIFLISMVVFIILLFIVPDSLLPSEQGNTILTVVTFLFGIIAGFYIIVTTTDYNSVKSILAAETAGWISLHQNILIYDTQFADKLSLLIDEYVRRAFDFEIIDYVKSTHAEFETAETFVVGLPYKENFATLHGNIRNNMDAIITARQQLTVLGARTLSIFQWTILFVLAAILIFSLYGLRTGELFFDITTVAISSSVILVLLLIRELDLYIWNERTFSFDIFENVLKSIGQLSYYPAESIEENRIYPQDKEYRIGTRVNFPKNTDRKIEIKKTN